MYVSIKRKFWWVYLHQVLCFALVSSINKILLVSCQLDLVPITSSADWVLCWCLHSGSTLRFTKCFSSSTTVNPKVKFSSLKVELSLVKQQA